MSTESRSLKTLLGKAATGNFIVIFLLAGLIFVIKDSTVSVWKSPEDPTMYQIAGSDGRALALVTTPGNYVYLAFSDLNRSYTEMVLTRMRGTRGVNFFGPFWRLSGPGSSSVFDWRIYGDGVEPWTMHIEILDKVTHGNGNHTFPDIGEDSRELILMAPEKLRFEGMWLRKTDLDQGLLTLLEGALSAES